MAPDSQKSSPGASATTTAPAITLPHRPGTSLDQVLIDQYVTRDLIHTAALIDQQARAKDMTIDQGKDWAEFYKSIHGEYRQWFPPSRVYGEGYNGYGNGHTDGKSGLLYPNQKPRLGHRKTLPLKVKRKDMAEQAELVEELVPIRLDVDWDKIKLRDSFTWNIHDRVVTMKLFTEQLAEDLGIPPTATEPVLEQVRQQMTEQIGEFFPLIFKDEEALDPELPYSAYKNDELRILIKLNITIGPHTLVDQFEWDINNPLNSPEEFAQSMARDLSLSGEFTTAIAHCIREQSQLFVRSCYIVGHPFDGRPIEDADLVAAFLPSPLPSVFRPQQQAKEYAPYRADACCIICSSGSGTGRSKVKAGARDGVELSESSESEGSAPDSPAMSHFLQGTARTRGMRGAATAAQQRMANIGRSETPEAAALHHHETRTSARKFGGRDAREESMDGNPSLVVKLKIGREKLRQYLRDRKNGIRPQGLEKTPSYGQNNHTRSQSAMSDYGTPAPGTMRPPITPGMQNLQTSRRSGGNGDSTPQGNGAAAPKQGQIGRVDAPPPPPAGQPAPAPPAPPDWLAEGLATLHTNYPNDSFEGMMRYSAVDVNTELSAPAPPAGAPTPAGIKYMYLPRIRCHDCPGKLYTPGPGMTVENFEVHLKNRLHKEKVEARLARTRDA